jgi:hypothetical protein
MPTNPNDHDTTRPGVILPTPWYRQFWPWFIIVLPASAVVAGLLTFWLAATNPDPVVIDQNDYQRLNRELKAQPSLTESDGQDDNGSGGPE